MPPWDMSRYKHSAPVWYASWRRSRRRIWVRRAVLAAGAILYGIAVWLH